MRATYAILALLLVAACATPQQRCVQTATRDLQVIDSLILETNENLRRGYAIREDVVPTSSFNWCFGNYGSTAGISLCSNNSTRIRRTPVAIDPDVERAKLANLEEQRVSVAARAQSQLAACEAQFGT